MTIGLADNKAYVWNTETGRMLKDISDSGGSIEQSIVALFTGDGAAIVTLGTYKAVKIWNAKTFAQISAFSSE
ncbi:hypothetical protein, partial [Bacillus sp. II_CA]|uniref:hypothetical protein n=1 Tax=Bacillus sp. II_CA TaxID=3417451 RepID=UPI003CFA24E0